MVKRVLRVTAALALATSIVGLGPVGADARRNEPGPLEILITNDDGWRGPGGSSTPLIVALRDALLAAGHDVTVVAPGTDQSGQGGRISLPPLGLELANPEPGVWTVTPGSPADSVFFAVDEIVADDPPDLVISGMNPGNNLGTAVNHSGTVNAALTALELGVPSIAMNVGTVPGWPGAPAAAASDASAYVVALVAELQRSARHGQLMPEGVALNVCYPVLPGPVNPASGLPGSVLAPLGTKTTTLDTGPFLEFDYTATSGQSGAPGNYTIGLGAGASEGAAGTDVRAVHDGYVSITPLDADRDVDGRTRGWLRALTHRIG